MLSRHLVARLRGSPCCDPAGAAASSQGLRQNGVDILRAHQFAPRWLPNSNAPDVRLAMIERMAGQMRQRTPAGEKFQVNDIHWLRVSKDAVVRGPLPRQRVRGRLRLGCPRGQCRQQADAQAEERWLVRARHELCGVSRAELWQRTETETTAAGHVVTELDELDVVTRCRNGRMPPSGRTRVPDEAICFWDAPADEHDVRPGDSSGHPTAW